MAFLLLTNSLVNSDRYEWEACDPVLSRQELSLVAFNEPGANLVERFAYPLFGLLVFLVDQRSSFVLVQRAKRSSAVMVRYYALKSG